MKPFYLKRFAFVLALCLNSALVLAQGEQKINKRPASECGTTESKQEYESSKKDAYYGNNKALIKVLRKYGASIDTNYFDQVKEGTTNTYASQTLFAAASGPVNMPIKAWVHRRSNGSGGPSQAQVEGYIVGLNNYFSSTNIRFFVLCDIGYVNNDTYFDGVSNSEFDQMVSDYFTPGTVNLHLVNTSDGSWGGLAKYPSSGDNGYRCAVGVGYGDVPEVAAHEIGHTFGLRHTHRGSCSFIGEANNRDCDACSQEVVSRTYRIPVSCGTDVGAIACEVLGDRISDTEADPELSRTQGQPGYVNPVNCTYDAATIGTDALGERWRPNPRNLMSYSQRGCRDQFTNGQVGVMYYWIDRIGYNTYPVSISGPNYLCGGQSASFTLNGATNATSYNWQIPSGWFINNQGSATATLTATNNYGGIVTVRPSCGSNSVSRSIVSVVDQLSISGDPSGCPGRSSYFSTQSVPGVSYTWTALGDAQINSGQGGSSILVQFGSNFNGGRLEVRATNPCNGSQYSAGYTLFRNSNCGGRLAASTAQPAVNEEIEESINLKMYPNPTENWLEVSLIIPDKSRFQLNVYSSSGQLMMPLTKMDLNEHALIDVSSLTTGTYLLEARSVNKRYLRRFIKR